MRAPFGHFHDVDVLVPGSPGWERARQLFDASLDRRPAEILRPRTTDAAVALVAELQEQGRDFTLKSGGHSAAGLSVRGGVLTVDLSALRSVEVDARRGRAHVSAGALMADLDTATTRFGLATTGGTVSHTGVVGLACGGGLGWLMGRYGLACDNIIGASVVRDGALRRIDASTGEFHRLRGAGTTLGLVAELTLAVHQIVPRFEWTTVRFGGDEAAERLVRFHRDIDDLPLDVGCSFTVQADPAAGLSGVIDIVAPADAAAATAWRRHAARGSGDVTHEVLAYTAVQRRLDRDFPFGGRSYRRSLCLDTVDPEFVQELAGRWSGAPLRMSLTLDVLHGAAVEDANRQLSCFPRRRYTTLLTCAWRTSGQDALGRQLGRDEHRAMTDVHRDVEHFGYANYSSTAS
jgi:hypothetical protein